MNSFERNRWIMNEALQVTSFYLPKVELEWS